MLLLLLACDGADLAPPIDGAVPLAPVPQGELQAAFDFDLPIAGSPWTAQPAATLVRSADQVTVEIAEIWRERTPYFPDCPVTVRLSGPASDDPRTYALVLDEVVEDPCSIHPYAPGETYVLRFEPRDRAFRWLAESMDVTERTLESAEEALEADLGPATQWFAFWGPATDALWPLGHIFP